MVWLDIGDWHWHYDLPRAMTDQRPVRRATYDTATTEVDLELDVLREAEHQVCRFVLVPIAHAVEEVQRIETGRIAAPHERLELLDHGPRFVRDPGKDIDLRPGLRVRLVTGQPRGALRANHVRIALASEAGIIRAMRLLWERLKVIVEPSAAVPLAAMLENPKLIGGGRVAVILSGGNVDLDTTLERFRS